MIQRIQSIYLAGVLLLSVIMFFVPYCAVLVENGMGAASFLLDKYGIYEAGTVKILKKPSILFDLILWPLMLLIIVNIFLYNRRKLQIFIGKICMLIVIFLFASVNYELFNMTDLSGSAGHIRFLTGWYIPFVQLILLFLSVKAIQKDEDLVRSADRLR